MLREREDTDMVIGALEILVLAVGGSTSNNMSACARQDANMSEDETMRAERINSEMLTHDTHNVELLLDLMMSDEFYVKYTALQLMTALSNGYSAFRLREQLLSSPNSVNYVIDLLAEREIVRNEALILLVGLARGSAETGGAENDDGVQKLLVFGGIFEKLFALFVSETSPIEDSNIDGERYESGNGACNGISDSVVVGDSIELLNNLLRNNVSHQTLFRESMHLKYIPSLLGYRDSNERVNFGKLTKQQKWNMLCALEMVSLLTTASTQQPGSSSANELNYSKIYNSEIQNRSLNQDVLLSIGVLQILISVALEGVVNSVAVRSVALTALGDMINTNPSTSTSFEKEKVLGAEPALNSVLRVAIKSNNAGEVESAMHVIRCYLENNRIGQELLLATIAPITANADDDLGNGAGMDEVDTFGGILMKGLLGSLKEVSGGNQGGSEDFSHCDLRASTRAAGVLSLLLSGNVPAKERCLRTPIEIQATTSIMLMPKLISYMQEAPLESIHRFDPVDKSSSPIFVQIIMLKVLSIWLHECPKAIRQFLSNDLHLPMIVDMVIHTPKVANEAETRNSVVANEDSDDSESTVILQSLAAVVIGMCLVYGDDANDSADNSKLMKVLDVMSSRVGVSRFFKKFEMVFVTDAYKEAISGARKKHSFSRSSALIHDVVERDDIASAINESKSLHFSHVMDNQFVGILKELRSKLNNRVVTLYSNPNSNSTTCDEMNYNITDDKPGESQSREEQIQELKKRLEECYAEMKDLRMRNKILAEEVTVVGKNGSTSDSSSPVQFHGMSQHAEQSNGRTSAVIEEKETRERSEAQVKAIARATAAEAEAQKANIAAEKAFEDARIAQAQVDKEQQLRIAAQDAVSKAESDLEALSGAYNSLEKVNIELEAQLRAHSGSGASETKFYSDDMINDLKSRAVEEKVEEVVSGRITQALEEAQVS